MSFMAISSALLRVFDIGFSLGFVVFAWPFVHRTVGVDLGVRGIITKVLSPIIVIGAAVDVLRLHRLTLALFEIEPPALFMGILAGEPARVVAESAWLSTVLSPW